MTLAAFGWLLVGFVLGWLSFLVGSNPWRDDSVQRQAERLGRRDRC